MFQLEKLIFEARDSLIVLLRFLLAWSVVVLCGWSLVSATIGAFLQAKQMHQIPCTKCQFFTNNYRLKCPVKPHIANTEDAINCRDYQPH